MSIVIKRDDHTPRRHANTLANARWGQADKVKLGKKEFIDNKAKERAEIQSKIRAASEKRDKYITEERKKSANGKKNTLDEVMLNTVREQAQKKN